MKKKKKWMTNTCWTIRVSRETVDDIWETVFITSVTLAIVAVAMFVIYICKEYEAFHLVSKFQLF